MRVVQRRLHGQIDVRSVCFLVGLFDGQRFTGFRRLEIVGAMLGEGFLRNEGLPAISWRSSAAPCPLASARLLAVMSMSVARKWSV
jgi:hypothetical protein